MRILLLSLFLSFSASCGTPPDETCKKLWEDNFSDQEKMSDAFILSCCKHITRTSEWETSCKGKLLSERNK